MKTDSLPIDDALRLNARALVRHDVRVALQYEAEPTLKVNQHKVLQILVNLIRNAKYACDESGRADKRITVRVTGDAERVRIAVIDNGMGIPPENLNRIFSHGFTTKKDGHGFGRHSGANAVREMGGSLTVQSEGPGKGATFILERPVTTTTASSSPAPFAPKSRTRQETILLVDDEPPIRAVLRVLLQRLGYHGHDAGSAAEAQAPWRARADEIDLLLTDMVIPDDVSGEQLARQLQSERPGLKVIFFSGHRVELAGADGSLREGVNFLPRPIPEAQLAAMVRATLDQPAACAERSP